MYKKPFSIHCDIIIMVDNRYILYICTTTTILGIRSFGVNSFFDSESVLDGTLQR